MDLRCGTKGVFLMLLQLNLCRSLDKTVTLEKHIGLDADIQTPICSNETENFITVLICKIKEYDNGDAWCRLRYIHGNSFENDCGSKMKLKKQNHTVFLHLKDLTPDDSGLYSCDCFTDATVRLRLTIAVEDLNFTPDKTTGNRKNVLYAIVIFSSVIAFIIIFGAILVVLYKRMCCRQQSNHAKREEEEMETYAALQEPNNDLYQTIVNVNSALVSGSKHQPFNRGREYENIKCNAAK